MIQQNDQDEFQSKLSQTGHSEELKEGGKIWDELDFTQGFIHVFLAFIDTK